MPSLTLTIPESMKAELKKFAWVNWSLLARAEIEKQTKNRDAFERIKKLISKSKFTEKDAEFFSEKVKKVMHDDLIKEDLV